MGFQQIAVGRHFNGTATVTPTDVDFNDVTASILIDNIGTTNDLLVSFDGGTKFKTIPAENSLGYDDMNLKKIVVKTNVDTTNFEIVVTVDED